jgi:hypothetical protein
MKLKYIKYTSDTKIETLYQLIKKNNFSILYWSPRAFGIEDYNNCLVYFDHKIENKFSSFPELLKYGYFNGKKYSQLIKELPDETEKNNYINDMNFDI